MRTLKIWPYLTGATTFLLLASPGLVLADLPRTVSTNDNTGLIIEEVGTSAFPNVLVTVGVAGGLAALQESGEEFVLTENDQDRPVTLEQLDSSTLNVVIVFDKSGSMGNAPMQAAKNAALAFIEALPVEVGIGLVSFSTDATVDVPITQDRKILNAAVEALDSDGNTSLYDGLILATSLFDPSAERKVLVVLSDGGDNDSVATLEEALANVSVFTVEMIELATPESNRAALDQIAAPRIVRSTDNPAQLQDLYVSVAQALVGRVGLRYESLADFGETLSIRVTLVGGELNRSATAEALAPPPPAAISTSTTLPTVEIVQPADLESDKTVLRVVSFILICGGFLVSGYFASDRRVWAGRERLIPKGTDGRGRSVSLNPFGLIMRRLENSDRLKGVVAELLNAGGERSPGAVLLSTAGTALSVLIFGIVAQGIFLGLVLVAAVLVVARARLRAKIVKRKTEFIEQLPETLGTLGSMLRTGYGLQQALKAVADESQEPTRSWLGRVLLEVSTGRDLIDALRFLAVQIDSLDFDWVVAGIEISRDTGGDLARTLDTVAETIKERDKLRGQVQALTAEGRISAYVMLALPPGIGILSYLINPEFSGVLFETTGLIFLVVAGGLMVLGYFWMRAMISKVTL